MFEIADDAWSGWMAGKPLVQGEIDAFEAERVPRLALVQPLALKTARVLFDRNYRFLFNDDGVEAFLIPAFGSSGKLEDLVAWDWEGWALGRSEPALHYGERVAMLGQEQIYGYRLNPLPVWDSPLSWLKARRVGVCLIDPRRSIEMLRDCGPFKAESLAAGQRLVGMFSSGVPNIIASDGEGEP